jgi:uncharacterized protein
MSRPVDDILSALKTGLRGIYKDRLRALTLFGSHARGDAEAGSDVDVLVVLEGDVSPCDEIRRTSDLIVDLSLEHDTVVSLTFVSKEFHERGQGPLVRNVSREGVAA